MIRRFFNLPSDQPDFSPEQRRLYRLLSALLVVIPASQLLTALGIFAILLVVQPAPEGLLAFSAAPGLLAGLMNLLLYASLRKASLERTATLWMALNGSFAVFQFAFWPGLVWLPVTVVLLASLCFLLGGGLPRRGRLAIAALTVGLLAVIVAIETAGVYPRLGQSTGSQAALDISVTLMVSMVVLSALLGILQFRTIASRLAITMIALIGLTLFGIATTSSTQIEIIIGVLMGLLGLLAANLTSQSISLPLADQAEKIVIFKNGEFQTRMTVERKDEIGRLAEQFNALAGEIQSTLHSLELQVEDRTEALLKQSSALEIAGQVAQAAVTAQDLDDLLDRASQWIMDHFDSFFCGFFLIDGRREFAVLRAAPSEAGRDLLSRGYRLEVGQAGSVGYVSATGTARITLDTRRETAFFQSSLLPETRSEISLPMKLNDQVIGVLDVQNAHPEAFTASDLSTLQLIANLLALAVQRLENIGSLASDLDQLGNTYKAFTLESWSKFSQEEDFKPGYRFNGVKIIPIDSIPAEKKALLKSGHAVALEPEDAGAGATVLAPLKLRNQVIGALTLRFQTATVATGMLDLVTEIAGRLAVSLENARLYAETQKLVQRERAVSEISNRMTTSFNIENILRTTVMEIGRLMPDAEVVVQLEQNKE